MKRLFLALMLMAAAVAAHADAPRLRFLGSLGYGWGGASLVSGNYATSDGSTGTEFQILAGTGVTWTAGGDLRLFNDVYLQATVGQQRNTVPGSNFEFNFQRTPVELMGFYSVTNQVRVGLGVHKSYNARLTGTGVAAGYTGTGTYEGSLGGVAEVQYFFWSPSKTERAAVLGVNFRYIQENFTLSTADGGTGEAKSGDQVAVGLVLYY